MALPVFFMQPDANISGPVYIPKVYDGRNKTFFFFGYQRLHEKKAAQIFQTTPTPEMRQGIFNFPGVVTNPIYDPSTTRASPMAPGRAIPVPEQPVPLNRFDPVARKVLDLDPWVHPNNAGSFTTTGPSNNLLADEFARTFFDDYNLRIDHQFSTAFKLYGSFTENNQSGFGRPKLIKDRPAGLRRRGGQLQPLPAAQHVDRLHLGDQPVDRERLAWRLLPAPQRYLGAVAWAETGRASWGFPTWIRR